MKRSWPSSLVIVVLVFAPSFAQQQSKLNPQPADDIPTAAKKPAQSPRAAKSDYPFLPESLMSAEFENADGTMSILPRYKGRILVVNLWAIWCGPCRDEMPQLQSLYDTHHSRGLEILGLNIGDVNGEIVPFENIEAFATRSKISYPLGRADSVFIKEIYLLSKQQVVPQTLLIDRDGHLRGIFVGAGQRNYALLRQTLEKVMAD